MEQWKLVTIMVAVFAFSLEIRPMDSFLVAYLTSPKINITLYEVSEVLTPITIYSSVLGSFLVFMLADYLLYKPLMLCNGLFGMLTYLCLTGTPSIFRLKVVEVLLSLFLCAEVSYFGYLYAKIKDKEQYQMATGYAKAGKLSGTCVSGILGQLVVYFNDYDYSTLPYYSLTGVTFASLWAWFLPSINQGKYFHFKNTTKIAIFSKEVIHDPSIPNYSTENIAQKNVDHTTEISTNPLKLIYEDFKNSYSDRAVLRWSFWHIMGLTGYVQFYTYIRILYTYITDESNDKNMLFNGLVDSLATMCAAFSTYNIGKMNMDWARHGDIFLTFTSFAVGSIISLCFCLKNIYLVYIIYICYEILIQSAFVIVISQIGKRLGDECYTLVLGFNAFLATSICMLMSFLLTQIKLPIPEQFLVYGGIYLILGVLYGNAVIFRKQTTKFYQLP